MAFSEPAMVDRLPPVTRFSVAPLPLSNVTLFFLPIEKLFQSMMPVAEDWSMVRPELPDLAMEPLPATY